MSVEAQFQQLLQVFQDHADQAKVHQNSIKVQENAIRELKGHEFSQVTITFDSPDGTQAPLIFPKNANPESFQNIYDFVLNLRQNTVGQEQAALFALQQTLATWSRATQQPPEPPEDDGGDDDEEPPEVPSNNGNGKQASAEKKDIVPESIKKRAESAKSVEEASL